MRLRYLFLLLAVLCCLNANSQIKNEDDLKKQADQHFDREEYNLAYKLFAQLVSLYPKDPQYNYKLGVCMLFTEPDKKKPYTYLQIAAESEGNGPKDAKFYLAKTYHANYRFDEAIKLYTEYKAVASSSSIKRLQVDREIQACKNGKRLLSNLSDLVVITKKQLSEADYFKGYDVKDIGGKLLVKPDEYKSSYDKKKKDRSVVYLPKSAERLYYSSDGTGTGRDIYYVNKLPNGSWSEAVMLPPTINTEFDEDYPFLHPNGNTLYFSSKGHNSMGGYDIFKTTFDVNTQTWSKPQNLEFPINSPDNDILFVTDSLEKTAYFSTGRYSPYGQLDVLKISTERRPMNFAVMKGTVVREDESQSIKSKISVKNVANGEIVGTYQANDNGGYAMELPNGGTFIFTVETPGIRTQSEAVTIPIAYALKPYKQTISYDKEILKIVNDLDGSFGDEDYSMMIDLIERKAKLEVNEVDSYNNNTALKDASKSQDTDENKKLNSVSTTNPTIVADNEPKSNSNKNITNEQLLAIAKTDANEASEEATKLKKEAQDAFGLATQKTAESVAIQKDADQAIEQANAISDVIKKNEELSKANQLKDEAKIAAGVANTATNMAKKLEVDANTQQKEADLTNQYIAQLETVISNTNNKEALKKLEDIQKELNELSKQKNQSSELLNSLKAESELKQQELISSEKKNSNITNEIIALTNESENLEKDLTSENDKALKESISAQIRELTTEIELRKKDLATSNQKIESLKNEVEGVNQELQIAAKILNEKLDGVAISTKPTNDNDSGNAINTSTENLANAEESTLSYNKITNKYAPKIASAKIDSTSKTSVTQQNDILKTYNKEVTDLLAIDKNTLAKIKDATEKKKIDGEIKKLEKLKIENDKAIVSNNAIIKQIDQNALATTPAKSEINSTSTKPNTSNFPEKNSASTTETTGINSTTENGLANNTVNKTEIDNKRQTDTSSPAKDTSVNNNNEYQNSSTDKTYVKNENNTAQKTSATQLDSTSASKTTADQINKGNNNNDNLATNSIKGSDVDASSANESEINNSPTNTRKNNTIIDKNITENITTTEPIDLTLATDEASLLNNLTTLKNGLNANSNAAAQIFSYSDYQENTTVALKQLVLEKFDAAKRSEANLNSTIAQTEASIRNSSSDGSEALLVAAENLSSKAYQLRKEAATKTGAEKEALIKQATENEKSSTDKKLEASIISKTQNKTKFDTNSSNLAELKKLTANKTSDLISQATVLIDEAALNFKQAQNLRIEAAAYSSDAAKLGGLSNAEEKENEALLKQQKASDILAKINPTFQFKTVTGETNSADAIENVNAEIKKTSQLQQEAYLALSTANQNELKSQSDKLIKNPAYNSNTDIQELKVNSDKFNNEAKEFIGQSLTAKTPAEKAKLLLKANAKEIEAISVLNQAVGMTKSSSVAATTNPNAISTTTVASTSTTKPNNNKAINTNSTAVNNTNSEGLTEDATNKNSNTIVGENRTNATNTNNVTAKSKDLADAPEANLTNNGVTTNSISPEINDNDNNTNANTDAASVDKTSNSAKKTDNSSNRNVSDNGVSDEASKLKAGLNSSEEKNLLNYNSYTNSEAVTFKDEATKKISSALNEDAQLATALDNLTKLASDNAAGNSSTQQTITNLLSEADKLNDDAYDLRTSAASKTNADKNKDIEEAKTIEATAASKKVDAAKKQDQLNKITFEDNQQSLNELSQLAKGKNVAELNNANIIINEAYSLFTQANTLREEANAYGSDAAKLGGYNNAEEKQMQALAKQQSLLDIYKKQFPNYIFKKASSSTDNPELIAKLNETKTKINANNQTHGDGLALFSKANETEYKNRVVALPSTLTTEQNTFKTKAQTAYRKNQDLLVEASQTKDLLVKKNLLIQAAVSGQDAIKFLSQISNPNPLSVNGTDNKDATENSNNRTAANNNNNSNKSNNTISNNTVANTDTLTTIKNKAISTNITNATSAGAQNTSSPNKSNLKPTAVKIKVDELGVKVNNAYTAEKPIPLDQKIQDGLVFKVQIGAFKTQLPNSTFKGLTPVIAQTTPNGYIRYMAGNFEQYGGANAVKNDLRDLGYNGAFVVAYYNGVRINLSEAIDKAKVAGQIVEATANTTAGLTENVNMPKNIVDNALNTAIDMQPVEITNELEKMNGLLYTVQVGVYSKQITRSQLYNLKPIYTEKLPSGLFRYTAGIYNLTDKVIEDKRKVVSLGVKDAFVTSYYNAKRIPVAEAQKIQLENNSLTMEKENPIIFSGTLPSVAPTTNTVVIIDMNTVLEDDKKPSKVTTPFSNGVSNGPTPTAENGVKADETGISYRVQIGAYKNQVPNEVAAKFLNMKTWPVKNVVINELYIYNIGNFTGTSFAKKLRDEAVSVGITDAYITVYKDGNKLYGSEAAQYLSK